MTGEFIEANGAFVALYWLFVKHFICDFPLQANPWFYTNKGTYFHPGGIAHATIHGLGTFIVLMQFVDMRFALQLALFDVLVHYHIDWAKMNISKRYDLQPNNSERFWILLGLDQLLHHITYFVIIYYAFVV